MQTEIFKRPARFFAFTLAMSLLLTGALFSQHVAYEDKSREAAIAAERFQQLQRQDYELRFNTGKSESASSLTRRESLQHSALQLRNAESAWQSLSTEQARLGVFSDVCSFSILCSYFSGLLLAACLLLMAVKRLLSRAAAFPGTASGFPEL
jgi:hypothetical protein